MHKATTIAEVFEEITPREIGLKNDELGFIYGNPEIDATSLAHIWNIHTESISSWIEKKANMIIFHEEIWLAERNSSWYQGSRKKDVYSKNVGKELLDEHQIIVYRSHSNWNVLD